MSGNMSVSMTLRLLDQVSGPVRGIVEELRKLDKVSTEIGRNPSGDARASAWQSETSAVRGVIAQLGELRAATIQSGATSSINATIGRLNAERSSIQGVTAQFGALRTAAAEAAAPIDGAIAKLNAEKAGIESVTAAMRQLGTASVQARTSGRRPGDAPNWGPRWDEEGGSGPARSRSREGWARASDTAEAKPETPHPPIAAASSGGILDGMIGFGEMGTGYRLAKGSYEQGAEARSLDTGMRAAGYSDADVAQINTLAAELSRQSKVFSANTIVGLARDARTILGSTEHAAEAMPTILQLATIVKAKRPGHGEEGVAELLRGMEASGSTTSMEAFGQQANSIAKVMNVFGKTIGLDSFAQFFIKAGTATPHLSNEFIEQKLPHLLQVMGGEQTGTMIQSIMRGTIAGRMDKDARETMQDYGLIDPSKVDEKGHMMPGAFLHGDVLARDPSEYATRYLKPALDARNLSEDEEEAVLGKMFSNRNVARGMSILINQDPIIQKDAAQIRSARGLDAAPMLAAAIRAL